MSLAISILKNPAHIISQWPAVICKSPLQSAAQLNELRYQLLANGNDISEFHATEDRQFIRDQVFQLINSLDDIRVHVIYGDKHRVHPSLQSAEGLYGLFGKAIVKYALMAYGTDLYRPGGDCFRYRPNK